MKVLGTPLTMGADAFKVRHAPPDLGADGVDVLREAGYSPERIDTLIAAGILSGERRGEAA